MRYLSSLAIFFFVAQAHAGLYYSGEPMADLPSQWRGFLVDQRTLRMVAVKPMGNVQASPTRVRYQEEAEKLEKASAKGKLKADELADLGALYVRLGETSKAVELLRGAQREHPNHFKIAANLGTAWQLNGDLNQAAAALEQAVKLAPGKLQKAEEYQLKLVKLRQRAKDALELDDLFEIHFVGEDSKYQAGKLAEKERKKMPSNAVAIAQQLALWLPADGRLLWQLGELSNAHGDVRTAAAIMDGCVNEFGMSNAELRKHRQIVRAAADELAVKVTPGGTSAKSEHEGHAGIIKPKSKRPLVNRLDQAALPAIDAKGVNPMPWALLSDTLVDKSFKPTFPKYLQELNGKQVMLTGFMQPTGEDLEPASFMLLEYPVGCWYCEVPELTSILLVKMPEGKTATYTRGLVKVVGTLELNASDPESFLYVVRMAKVAEAD